MVRVSVVVGMNGADAANESVVGPTRIHVPFTGGSKAGMPAALVTGAESLTVTSWLDGTLVAPLAGTVDTTASGFGGAVVVTAAPDPPWAEPAPPLPCLPNAYAPAPTTRTAATTTTTIQTFRWRLGGGTSIWYSAMVVGTPVKRRGECLSGSRGCRPISTVESSQ